MSKKGFTIIELLVVISIIAVLSMIGFASFREVQENGRDAKRRADLGTIQSALEQYNNDQHYYPVSIATGSAFSFGTRTYLNNIPTDPINSAPSTYCYKALRSGSSCEAVSATDCDNSAVVCTSYCLYARLENGPANLTDSCSSVSTRNFRVTPP